jgi:hypothetical protein
MLTNVIDYVTDYWSKLHNFNQELEHPKVIECDYYEDSMKYHWFRSRCFGNCRCTRLIPGPTVRIDGKQMSAYWAHKNKAIARNNAAKSALATLKAEYGETWSDSSESEESCGYESHEESDEEYHNQRQVYQR